MESRVGGPVRDVVILAAFDAAVRRDIDVRGVGARIDVADGELYGLWAQARGAGVDRLARGCPKNATSEITSPSSVSQMSNWSPQRGFRPSA